MDTKSPNEDVLIANSTETDPVTREMVHERARALALKEGRAPTDVSQSDYEKAKRELTGESDQALQEAILDSIPEVKREETELGSTGHQLPESPSEDEDDEGRSESEQLAEKGVGKAEQEQILQAARTTKNKIKLEP